MPTAGLSLVGFMDELKAIDHLRTACCPADPSDAAVRAEWHAAQANLGAPIPKAGAPQIQPIPAASMPYVTGFMGNPWVTSVLQQYPGVQVVLIEIDPLLAYQFTVDLDRSSHHCAALGRRPTIDQLLPVCLPAAQTPEQFLAQNIDRAVLISSQSTNVTIAHGGWFGGPPVNHPIAGVYIGTTLPFAHVTRFSGRCYLHNGFHRAVGIRMAGATHMPCLLRDVTDAAAAGVRTDGSTFSEVQLSAVNAPTVGHFAGGRAWGVQLRRHRRVVHVSWAEHLMPVE